MQVTAMDINKLLPRTNCEDCGEASCMAFATKLSEKEAKLDLCTELSPEAFAELEALLAPAVREITIGTGDKTVTIGGDEVLYRYELTYYNPTALVHRKFREQSQENNTPADALDRGMTKR